MGSQTSTSRHHALADAHTSGIPGISTSADHHASAAFPPGLGTPSAWQKVAEKFSAEDLPGPHIEGPPLIDSTEDVQPPPDEADMIPCVFTWLHGGHSVYLTGTFNGWSTDNKIPLCRSGHEFAAVKELPRGIHLYKFIVDEQWKFAPDQRTQSDEHGNINNILDISAFQRYAFKIPTDYELSRTAHYHQSAPDPSEYTTDAPTIPILLAKSSCAAPDPYVRPNTPLHAITNHLYHDNHASVFLAPIFSCISTTFRWRNEDKLPNASLRHVTYIYATQNPLTVGFDRREIENPLFAVLGPRKSRLRRHEERDGPQRSASSGGTVSLRSQGVIHSQVSRPGRVRSPVVEMSSCHFLPTANATPTLRTAKGNRAELQVGGSIELSRADEKGEK